MTDATNHKTAVPTSSIVGPAIDATGAISPWVRQAMDRAAEAGIDPRRVALALGIPLQALQGADTTNPDDKSAR